MECSSHANRRPRAMSRFNSQSPPAASPHSGTSASPTTRTSQQKPRVAIVGAGFAGLRCAEVLLRNDIEVIVFEAKDKVGGRVCQGELDGHPIDLGPNWIHGTENNPIYEIAQRTKTVYHSWDHGRTRIVDDDDKEMEHARAEKLSTAMWNVVGTAYEFSNKEGPKIPAGRSLVDYLQQEGRDWLRQHFQKIVSGGHTTTTNEADIEASIEQTIRLSDMWGGFVGTEYERQSLRFFWLEEMLDGENPFVANTYKEILAYVSEYALSKKVVRLEEPVLKILSVENAAGFSSVEVRTCKDLYSFDEVIITTPLGWLKTNPRAFEPPLSPRISQAISNISYGNLEKIYVKFPSAWWENPAHANGSSTNGGVSTPAQPASFTHWLSPRHKNLPNAQAVSLARLPPDQSQPILLVYTFGTTSRHNTIELIKHPTNVEQFAYLNAFLRPYYSTLPNYDPHLPACTPLAFYATSWSQDPYAGFGSYSNFQVGSEAADADIEALRDGMPDRRLWFAGEHTAPFVATGTTTGAYWAGEEVAERVLRLYGRERGDERTLPGRAGAGTGLEESGGMGRRKEGKEGAAVMNGWV